MNNDKNYRMLVMLQRVDRPKHWVFHCPNCKREIHELDDSEMVAMTDMFHSNSYGRPYKCDTGWCRIVFYFHLNQ